MLNAVTRANSLEFLREVSCRPHNTGFNPIIKARKQECGCFMILCRLVSSMAQSWWASSNQYSRSTNHCTDWSLKDITHPKAKDHIFPPQSQHISCHKIRRNLSQPVWPSLRCDSQDANQTISTIWHSNISTFKRGSIYFVYKKNILSQTSVPILPQTIFKYSEDIWDSVVWYGNKELTDAFTACSEYELATSGRSRKFSLRGHHVENKKIEGGGSSPACHYVLKCGESRSITQIAANSVFSFSPHPDDP